MDGDDFHARSTDGAHENYHLGLEAGVFFARAMSVFGAQHVHSVFRFGSIAKHTDELGPIGLWTEEKFAGMDIPDVIDPGSVSEVRAGAVRGFQEALAATESDACKRFGREKYERLVREAFQMVLGPGYMYPGGASADSVVIPFSDRQGNRRSMAFYLNGREQRLHVSAPFDPKLPPLGAHDAALLCSQLKRYDYLNPALVGFVTEADPVTGKCEFVRALADPMADPNEWCK